ncbi:MAG: DUF4190 domain-containing protein [Myxococcaceae bacterium]|nr:DUF4190 domain-containing protein [Myxococcaceae bacterium]MCA3016424.1 DUF4190 domain-containing protein [Myxococcaceae bacterium]
MGARASFGGRPVQPLGPAQAPTAPVRDDERRSQPAKPTPLELKHPRTGWGTAPTPRAAPPLAAPPASFAPRPPPGGPTNGLAIASLVCGLLCCVPFAGISAIVTGVLALNQLSAGGNAQKGRELAIAGIALGLLSCFLTLSIPVFRVISR